MRFHWMLLSAAAIPALVPAAARAGSSGFELSTANAIAVGSRCSLTDGTVRIIAMGSDVSIVYTDLGVRMPRSPSDAALSELESCLARFGATLHAGSLVSRIVQTINYGVDKSAGSSGKITANVGFATFETTGFTIDVPAGAVAASRGSESHTVAVTGLDACSMSDITGLFHADVAIAGSRSSTSESIALGALGVEGQDLRYDLTVTTAACPH